VKVETVYDSLGRVSQASNPYRPSRNEIALFTRTAYDFLGRVQTVTTPDNAVIQTIYDGNKVTAIDQAGKKRRSVTDALGRLIEVHEPNTGNNLDDQNGLPVQMTLYSYDALDNLRSVTQGSQPPRSFNYDSLKRLRSAFNPESGTMNYDYDANGNLLHKIDARNIVTTYEYDALGRVTSRSYANEPIQTRTPTVSYSYDTQGIAYSIGRLTAVTSSVSTTSYASFDALGRVTTSSQRTDGQTYSMSYEYDLAGHLKSEIYPTGRIIHHTFDAAGRLYQVTGTKGSAVPLTYASIDSYTPHGATRQMTLGNGLIEHTTYNSRLQPVEIGLGTTPTATNRLKLEYNYGVLVSGSLDTTQNNGDVQSQTTTVPGLTLPIIQTFEYDQLNRLSLARETNNGTQSWQQVYAYDHFGNRSFTSGTTLPSVLNNQTNPTVNPANNQLSSDASYAYSYDEAGNLIGVPGYTYTFDAENRIATSNYADPNRLPIPNTYTYDGNGRRVKKVSDNEQSKTIFVYNAIGQMVAEYNNSSPVSQNQTSYLTNDMLGTPRVVTKADGSVRSRHDYLPFGEEVFAGMGGRTGSGQQEYPAFDSSTLSRQKFTQKERDIETGLDYFEARYYSSIQGRFMSPDNVEYSKASDPQTWNEYLYCRNGPLNRIDPDGHNYFFITRKDGSHAWVWSKGDKYTDPNTGKTYQSDVTHLIVITIATTADNNRSWPATITLYGENWKTEIREEGYVRINDGKPGHSAVPAGEYFINLSHYTTKSSIVATPTGRALGSFRDGVQIVEPPVLTDKQGRRLDVGGNMDSYQFFRAVWGSKRANLSKAAWVDGQPVYRFGNGTEWYLHGHSERRGRATLGCVGTPEEKVLNWITDSATGKTGYNPSIPLPVSVKRGP
jgi:RHS repeat-associated protein